MAAGLALCLLVLLRAEAAHALDVFACEPEWAALAQELGGSTVTAFAATTARQDPHHIQARPSLISRLRAADLVVCTGAELEIGWMPVLLRQSANPNVQPGSPGYFEAAQYVRLLEVPAQLDRAMGDVHAAGNPHIQTDPRNIAAVAAALSARMQQLDPANAATIAAYSQNFMARWAAATQRWAAQAAGLRGVPIAVYHKNWAYLEDWLGLREVGTVEPKPGVPPGSQYLAQLVAELPCPGRARRSVRRLRGPARLRIRRDADRRAGVELPFTVGGSERATDLFGLFDDTIDRLVRGLGGAAHARQ